MSSLALRQRAPCRLYGDFIPIAEVQLYLHGGWEIIDLLENPKLAQGDQILAIPTLVRKLPEPVRKIIGDLSNTEKVLVGLDLRERT